jgi:hypothetical protein
MLFQYLQSVKQSFYRLLNILKSTKRFLSLLELVNLLIGSTTALVGISSGGG